MLADGMPNLVELRCEEGNLTPLLPAKVDIYDNSSSIETFL